MTLGGVPGVAPGNVVILGGGIVGINAAKVAIGMGAHVTVIDRNLNRLRELDDIFNGQVVTLASNAWTIGENLKTADLVVGAVLIPGASAPKLVRREMVSGMKRGAVMVDVAIDQGGCFETSHATTHTDPTLRAGWRGPLLRFEHACRRPAHLHPGAHQRHLPVPAGTGEPRPGGRLRAPRRPPPGRQYVQRLRDPPRRGRIPGTGVARTGGRGVGGAGHRFLWPVGMGLWPAKFHEKLDRLSAGLRGAGPRPALMGLAAVATWQVGDLPHEPPDLQFLAFPYFQRLRGVFRTCQRMPSGVLPGAFREALPCLVAMHFAPAPSVDAPHAPRRDARNPARASGRRRKGGRRCCG